jgi:hypothetical protein
VSAASVRQKAEPVSQHARFTVHGFASVSHGSNVVKTPDAFGPRGGVVSQPIVGGLVSGLSGSRLGPPGTTGGRQNSGPLQVHESHESLHH